MTIGPAERFGSDMREVIPAVCPTPSHDRCGSTPIMVRTSSIIVWPRLARAVQRDPHRECNRADHFAIKKCCVA
ncbi:hypothetical protein ACC740_36770, partial [Rhizobium ruizarguesonis]